MGDGHRNLDSFVTKIDTGDWLVELRATVRCCKRMVVWRFLKMILESPSGISLGTEGVV